MKAKKLVSILMASAMVLSLAACGSKKILQTAGTVQTAKFITSVSAS